MSIAARSRAGRRSPPDADLAAADPARRRAGGRGRDRAGLCATGCARSDVPKLFVNAEPGAILIGAQREFCRTWPNQQRGHRQGQPLPAGGLAGRDRARGRRLAAGDLDYGRILKVVRPRSRQGSASRANSHNSGRVSRGSMISSTQNVSAVRNGERSLLSRSSISRSLASGSGAASISARYAASMPPSSGSEPHYADGQA